MRNNKLGILCVMLFIVVFNNEVKPQETDTLQSMLKITKLHEWIDGENVENLKIDSIILSAYPTEANSEESTYINANMYVIFHNNIDTFLIRNISEWDVGSGYSVDQTDVFFWNKKPFFYYTESETLENGTGIKKRTEIYIENGKIIRKRYKEAIFMTESGDYIKVDIDSIPYDTARVETSDYETVEIFINKSLLLITNTDD